MGKILNITNGDSAVGIMKQAKIPGKFLPWRDVLHDGPVPSDLNLEALSEVRARFIAESGWGEFDAVLESFVQRDNVLKTCGKFDDVILWFEHDLYDQLQILQILDWFHQHKQAINCKLSMICTNQYLGLLSAEQMAELLNHESPVNDQQLELAATAWQAFCSSTPEKWQALLNHDTSSLPFLNDAVIRQLEEYPNCCNGLSRTANQLLHIVADGENNCWKIFQASQQQEQAIFMGDASFWEIIKQLLSGDSPLLTLAQDEQWTSLHPKRDTEIEITSTGRDVVLGKKNWQDLSDINQWIGGVHLTPENLWCWDTQSKTIVNR